MALAAVTTTPSAEAHVKACDGSSTPILCAVHHWRNAVHRLERRVAAPETRYGWTADRSTASATYRVRVRHLWYTRYRHWWHRTHPWSPAWLDDAICVHSHEAAWDDGGAPYWGGLQMDASFMATYGARFLAAWGTADQWTPLAQLIAAYRGYEARGWQPWPNTAAACGLL